MLSQGDEDIMVIDTSPVVVSPEEALQKAKTIITSAFGDMPDEHVNLLLYQFRRMTDDSDRNPTTNHQSLETLRRMVYGTETGPVLDDRERVVFAIHEHIQANKMSQARASDLLDLLSQVSSPQHWE